jgi:hypothetical protein
MRKTQELEAIRLAEQWKFEKGKIKKPPPPAESSDEVAAVYFVNLRMLSAKCSSASANDLAWCEAYIAGVIDTLGSGRNDLAGDAQDLRLCLRKKVSLGQVRQVVSKRIALSFEGSPPPIILNSPATNSVIAAMRVDLCK